MSADESSTPKRPRGRPPAAEPSSRITTWVPNSLYDQLTRVATRRDLSLSQTVRMLLAKRTSSARDD